MRLRYTMGVLAVLLSGCSQGDFNLIEPPKMSPVGAELPPASQGAELAAYPAFSEPDDGWAGGSADFFRDARARRPGDIITVKIAINDKASFNNTSALSRQAQLDAGADTGGSFIGSQVPVIGASGKTSANSSSSGQGSTVRSEKINLSVAAIVTSTLPNGYLVVDGHQEVMVNDEQRILHVSGIVHPRDITPDNAVSYERLAEARIEYGGRGRIAEEQRPTLAQKIWSKFNLF